MSTREDVYQKFGFTAEAAQLLETELGNILLENGIVSENLLDSDNPDATRHFYNKINQKTLGQLLNELEKTTLTVDHLDELFSNARNARNRLSHSFYREHNFRINSEEGCQIMLDDLENMHNTLLEAYKATLLLSGIDIDKYKLDNNLPTGHLPL